MSEIRSHPHLILAEHLGQIRAAANAIFDRHGRVLFGSCPDLRGWFEDCVALHDAGKASAAFQRYITAPERYRGDPKDKAHTPLSLLFAATHGPAAGWDWRKTLAVAQVAAGHHGEFRDLEAIESVVNEFEAYFRGQLTGLDHAALGEAVGLQLPRLGASEDEVADAVDAAKELLRHSCRAALDALSLDAAARYRLEVQLVFSILLEADKAYLAVPEGDIGRYLRPRGAKLPAGRVVAHLAKKPDAAVNDIRTQARQSLAAGMAAAGDGERVFTLTLPTGTGKTLLAATWALETRERIYDETKVYPPILIVLPFLTVIEQTAKEYAELFPNSRGEGELTEYHSLSDRTFARDLEDGKSHDFFLDAWRSDVVVTTFDQFLYAVLSPKARHQMRFHHLADAVVVLDEVQAFPCGLWEPLKLALRQLVTLGSTRVLAMSATQPGFLHEPRELVADPAAFFRQMARYRIVFRHRTPMGLSEFIRECGGRLADDWKGKRVMLTLNTRKSARRVRDGLVDAAKRLGFAVEFLTADVTPMDRLAAVERVKACKSPVLVVSTQCVEAGVDIDLDFVVRDFGPLDSVIQIAGRCNRNGRLDRGIVEVVKLFDDESATRREFAGMVYDKVQLDATASAFRSRDGVAEEEIHPLTGAYFRALAVRKETGTKTAADWAYWREPDKSARELLRGPERPQVTFVAAERDPKLRAELQDAWDVPDRWDRRRALRALAGRVAKVSVSIYADKTKSYDAYGDPFPATADEPWFWLLEPGRYSPETGIDLGPDADASAWGVLI